MTETETSVLPSVGDEVLEGKTPAVVTDVRDGVIWLRPRWGGNTEWPAGNQHQLTVLRTRAEMIAAGDL
jgi:hypothetical protein